MAIPSLGQSRHSMPNRGLYCYWILKVIEIRDDLFVVFDTIIHMLLIWAMAINSDNNIWLSEWLSESCICLCAADLYMVFPNGDTGKCTCQGHTGNTTSDPHHYPYTKYNSNGACSSASYSFLHVLKEFLHFMCYPESQSNSQWSNQSGNHIQTSICC